MWGVGDDTYDLVTQLIRSVLADMHAPLFAGWSGSTSYLIAVVVNGLLTIAYEGDCGCGVVNAEGRIDWTRHLIALPTGSATDHATMFGGSFRFAHLWYPRRSAGRASFLQGL